MFFSLSSGPVILNVLWMLGWSMIVLGFLVRLPLRVVAGISIAMIALHNLADRVPATAFGSAAWLWNIAHQPGVFRAGKIIVLAAYPLVPWVAVMAAGFCFGPILRMDAARRQRLLLRTGAGLTLAFFALRFLNIYGDPQPWSVQATPGWTVLSFLRCTKYPPSLSFLLMTLGPAMLIWRAFGHISLSKYNPLLVFGRVPLFYFIVHIFVAHALTYAFALFRYGTIAFLREPLPSMGGSASLYPPGFGYDLPVVYAVWLLVVILMYPLCVQRARLKEHRRDRWLSYV
jgi:uncharacterized membrane protein